jgi:hypothetical protein
MVNGAPNEPSSAVGLRPAEPPEAVATAADAEPFGLWATGRAPYLAMAAAYRSSAIRGRVAWLLVSASVVAYGLTALGNLWLLPILDAAESGTLTNAELELHDALVDPLNLLSTILFVLAAVAVLAWLSRVVDNIPGLTGELPRFSPRGAIGWWFAPLANLVMPYQVVRDVVDRLARARIAGLPVLAWWLLYLFSNIASYGVAAAGMNADTIEGLRSFVGTSMVYLIPRVVAGILFVVIIRSIEDGARELAVAIGRGPEPGPAWGDALPIPPVRAAPPLVASVDGPASPPPPPA